MWIADPVFMESGKRPVLAVDADAKNANLNEVLGALESRRSHSGELREERAGRIDRRYQILRHDKQAYLEMRLSDAIAEEDDYAIDGNGRNPRQGCYCL